MLFSRSFDIEKEIRQYGWKDQNINTIHLNTVHITFDFNLIKLEMLI